MDIKCVLIYFEKSVLMRRANGHVAQSNTLEPEALFVWFSFVCHGTQYTVPRTVQYNLGWYISVKPPRLRVYTSAKPRQGGFTVYTPKTCPN